MVLFGIFATNFTSSILAVVIPRLIADFHSSKSAMAWVVTAPVLGFAVLGPTTGMLGDLYGRRRVYLIGLGGCGVFSLATALAPSAGALLAFRTLASVMGSATGPAGIAIISTTVPQHLRVKVLGYWGLTAAGGPVVGLVAGGPVADHLGWRWIFAAQAPLTIVALVLAAAILPSAQRRSDVHFDVPGTALLATGVFCLLFAVNRAPSWGWTHGVVLTMLAMCPLAVASFVVLERRIRYPLIPLPYLRRRNFSASLLALTVSQFAYQGGFVLVPLMLSELFGFDSTHISLITMSRPIAWGIAGPIAGWLTVRAGERRVSMAGALLNMLGCLAIATIVPSSSQFTIVLVLALAGVGVGLMTPPLTSALVSAVDEDDIGVAGACNQMMIQIGAVLGTQIMQTVQLSRAKAASAVGSYHDAFRVGALLAALGIVAAAFVVRTPRRA